MVECRLCNTNNPAGMLHCSTCDGDLPLTNPLPMDNKPKMVIVHVEDALLDESAGERVAKRKGLSGKRFEREVALNLENSKAAPGAQPFLSGLASDNFTVAYLTNKDEEFRYRLQGHIRSLGFPMMADSDGVLVLPGSARDNIRSLSGRYEILYYFGSNAASTAKMMHIPGVYATIGDYAGQPENPYIAPETTPGAYTLSGLRPEPTPGAYTLTNPSDMGFRFVCRVCGKNPPMEECAQDARGVLVHMVDGGELRLVNEGMAQKMQQGIPQGPLRNPVPKPRRQTSKKTGKKRRESAKNYFQRLMSNDMMNKDFPRNDQRSAVALSYVEKEYGQRGVASVTKTWSPISNPTTEGLPIYSAEPAGAKNLGMVSAVVQVGRGVVKDIGEGLQDFYRALIGGRQSMTEKRMMLAVAEMHLDLTNAVEQKGGNAIGNVRLDYEHPTQGGDITLIATADALKVPKKNPTNPTMDDARRIVDNSTALSFIAQEWSNPTMSERTLFDMVAQGMQRKYGVRYMLVTPEQARTIPYLMNKTSFYNIHIFGANPGTWDEDAGIVYFNSELLTDREKFFREIGHETGAVIIASQYGGKKNIPRISPGYALTHGVDHVMFPDLAPESPPEPAAVWQNPASPKKVKKAEAAYKKFHGGKTPDEITTAQIDVGDVWYSLGECWTIGYMSPKENGDETQKFIHEMNEESKDGNYPVLYATMPENGEPMLIIKGGSMKIGMRDGKAWLID
jgi:uncharacterized protein YbjQ (UPF0145 family)